MVTETVFRASEVPAGRRPAAWRELMETLICRMDTGVDTGVDTEAGGTSADDLPAQLRMLEFGAVRVWSMIAPAMWSRRTQAHIRESDPGLCHLLMPLRGTARVRHAGHEAHHGPYDMHLLDTSLPWERTCGSMTAVGLVVPRKLLPLPADRLRPLLARRIPGRTGPGALLSGLVTRLTRDRTHYGPSEVTGLEQAVVHLLATTLSHHLASSDGASDAAPDASRPSSTAPPAPSRGGTLLPPIRAYVLQRLDDPDLTPRAIAAAHYISVSYLHHLFQAEGTTLAGWIRAQRLERARRDLSDPALSATPVRAIAIGRGFLHHSSFTRAFQTTYGVTPREYRRQALRARVHEGCGHEGCGHEGRAREELGRSAYASSP
ncbi:helix-turn-helix domain-containing protein [Streptomyces sp. 4N509B]|uniref:helix-turn-helix domain-containing protein n=1 Tax=Streptomyces sp. 4N509B TaxID=3457413 RepID=UPI003FD52446